MFDTDFKLRAFYFLAACFLTSCLSWYVVPKLLNKWMKHRVARSSEQIFLDRIVMGLSLALQITLMLDVMVHLSGGKAYLGFMAPISVEPSPHNHFSSLRDGMAGNLLFFIAAGFLAARAAWTSPEEEKLENRVQMLFPRLKEHEPMIEHFIELTLEQAAPAKSISLEITVEDYDQQIDAYKIHVKRREQFINLLDMEKYTSKRFNISVNGDDLSPAGGILGCISAANFIQLNANGGFVKKTPYLPRRQVFLTTTHPSWTSVDTTLQIPEGGTGIWNLEYWYWAKCGSAYSSKSRRPTELSTFKIHNHTSASVAFELTTDKAPQRLNSIKPSQTAEPEWKRLEALPSLELVLVSPRSPQAQAGRRKRATNSSIRRQAVNGSGKSAPGPTGPANGGQVSTDAKRDGAPLETVAVAAGDTPPYPADSAAQIAMTAPPSLESEDTTPQMPVRAEGEQSRA